jgi:hypothetical protein
VLLRQRPRPDPQLIQALVDARFQVGDFIENVGQITVSELARRDGVHAADVFRSMQLAFLAPDIVEAIINGSQPEGLTSDALKRVGDLPLAWDRQRALLD